ncbi:MAG: hypothetical protein RLZZ403_66 [Pseudomonadota bacterium]|jgi:glyoxylase-like metal-dependent hydrolase (beta-lactamase superfamily II)
MTLYPRRIAAAALLFTSGLMPALAQQDFSAVQIKPEQVAPGVYMLAGSGGNMSLLIGPDGAILVDDQYAPLTTKILAAVRGLTDKPLRLVVNTHWHGDHTGGNENLAALGLPIVAHVNVRTRLSTPQKLPLFRYDGPAAPAAALPIVTFTDGLTLNLNGETVRLIHVPNAHTDGDAIVHYQNANVFHMADVFWNGAYPRIDAGKDGSGGSLQGTIAAVERVLAMSNATSRFIPGHGPLPAPGPAALRTYLDVLKKSRDSVQKLIDQGLTEDQAVAAQPTREFDATWGTGYIKPDVFVRIVYRSLKP